MTSSAAVYALMCSLTLSGQTQHSGRLVLHVQSIGGCGWMGVQVRPMTGAFAASLGMAVPYGAIFDGPEPGSPAVNAGIQAGDVLTSINGSPVMLSGDVPAIISAMAPGSVVYLNTFRNRQMIKVSLVLGSGNCVNEVVGGACSQASPIVFAGGTDRQSFASRWGWDLWRVLTSGAGFR
jgi:hypothetical protein